MGSSSDIDISVANIWRAWLLFRKGKQPSAAIELFEYDLERNLMSLACDLQTGSYLHGQYQKFMVHDSKKRLIAVASVRDRVVHRLLYEYLVGIFDKRFMYDAWSCRPGKGLLGAINRTQKHMYANRDGWLWRSDIRKFFDSVDHELLHKALVRHILGTRARKLCMQIVDSYMTTPMKGMPIGNLTSQIFANIYLHEFDRYVMHQMRPLGYVRYGDDMVLWFTNESAARAGSVVAEYFLSQNLRLTVNSGSTVLQPTRQRLHYLGLELWPSGRRLDMRMRQRMHSRLTWSNYASYGALLAAHGQIRDKIELSYVLQQDQIN